MRLPTKIPTIIGLFLIIFIIGTIIVFQNVFLAPSNASGSQAPSNVHMSNVSDSTFTVSWTTQLPTTGTILVSAPGKSNQVYYDQRDTTGKLGTYTTHSITVRDAKSQTNYSIKLLSNSKYYDNNGQAYPLQTAATLPPNTTGLEPAYGTVHATTDRPEDGALIYLTIDGSQELSTLTKSTGLWLIPLNQIRTQDVTSYLPTVDRMTEHITVEAEGLESTAITDTLNDSPVPEMLLGKTYDFRRQQAKVQGTTALALRPTPVLPTAAVLGDTTSRTFIVSLTTPGQGTGLATTHPLIQGTGIPGKYVGVSVGITQIMSGSAKVDESGLWSYTPPKALAPGKQSVTITSVNQLGKTVAITHTFEVFKSGTQVLGDATPSATLAPTITPIITMIPTDTGTIAATTTPESTLSGQPQPVTGNELPAILLILLGVSLFASGSLIATH
ncbi:MAG TPA: Ig-like domain-containing protein [Patescibacteria group bacterium]|nr:Ig-like domain-containing protein [Patescibacteria group bacterium]